MLSRVKMVNGSRCYRALESVSIASALSTALTIYPVCEIGKYFWRGHKFVGVAAPMHDRVQGVRQFWTNSGVRTP